MPQLPTELSMPIILALLLSPATSSPLPLPPTLHRRDGDDDDDDKDDNHQLAIIISCSLVGFLVFGAAIMYLTFRLRRRQAVLQRPAGNEKSATSTTADERPPPPETQCSWCYISDKELCKWCSGEADDEDINHHTSERKRSEKGRLFLDTKQNGWRSAINSPDVTPRGSVIGSGTTTPAPGAAGPAHQNTGREGVRSISPQISINETLNTPGGSVQGKRSFRPGGIYEVQQAAEVAIPGRAVVRNSM
ncbi:hypothetical protein FPQ18DRAFT_65995 [Pyronema domesticum]|uniref:RanBP2-type domain-containing protein n=1 Tax=Pyronema omphalodes (strain CBS 100304) TaxID=1076935 RepID=U4LBS0_PYROM|nr:hypothetical protein FPQ18DRAFT_65995 [Pyronema domesticum]CCX07752.1 Protein of unknown function [Pyronema omphalodes CBS 100304]